MSQEKELKKLEERYQTYPSEKLIERVKNEGVYTQIAVEVAKKILHQRNIDITDLKKELNPLKDTKIEEEPLGLDTPGGQMIFTNSQSLDLTKDYMSRMDTILSDINESEKNREKLLGEKYLDANDDDLLEIYSQMLEKLTRDKERKVLEQTELKEYSQIIEIIDRRAIKIPVGLMDKHHYVTRIWKATVKANNRKKGLTQIIFGLLLGVITFFILVYNLESERWVASIVTLITLLIIVGKSLYTGIKLLVNLSNKKNE